MDNLCTLLNFCSVLTHYVKYQLCYILNSDQDRKVLILRYTTFIGEGRENSHKKLIVENFKICKSNRITTVI